MSERGPFEGQIDYEILASLMDQKMREATPPVSPVPPTPSTVTPVKEENVSALTMKIDPRVAAAYTPKAPEPEEEGAISRFVGQMGVGFVETAGTLPEAIEWAQHTLIGDDPAIESWAQRSNPLKDLNKKVDEWVSERTPEDIGLSDQIARGLGGIPLFFIPAMGAGKAAEVAKLAPKIANWFRIGTMAVLDSASTAGSIYSDELKKTGDADRASEVATKVFLANLPVSVALDKFGIFGDVQGTGLSAVAERAGASFTAGAAGGGVMVPTIAAIRGEEVSGREVAEGALVGGVVAATMGAGVQLLNNYGAKKKDFLDDNPETDQQVEQIHEVKEMKAKAATQEEVPDEVTVSEESLRELENLNKSLVREEVSKQVGEPDFKLKTEDELIQQLIETNETTPEIDAIILDKILAYYEYKQQKYDTRRVQKEAGVLQLEAGEPDVLTSDLSPAEKSAGSIESLLLREESLREAGLIADERMRKSPEGRKRLKEQLGTEEIAPDVADMILSAYDMQLKKQESPIISSKEETLLLEDLRKDAIRITNQSVEDFKNSLPEKSDAISAIVDEVTSRYTNSPLANKLEVLEKTPDTSPEVIADTREALDNSSIGIKLKEVKRRQKSIERKLKVLGKKFKENDIAEPKSDISEDKLPETVKRLKEEKPKDNVMKLRDRRTEILKERQALADRIKESELALQDATPQHMAMLDRMDTLDSELSQIAFKLNERVSVELKDITQVIPDFLKLAKDVAADPKIVSDKLTEVGKVVYKAGMTLVEFTKNMKAALGDVYDRFKDAIADLYYVSKRILASERGSTKFVRETKITIDTTPEEAATIIREADAAHKLIEDGDIRKDATRAIRLADGTIREGDSYKDIGNHAAESDVQELGYVTKSGTFIPASDFSVGATVPNETIQVSGQPKTTVAEAVEKMRSPAIERVGEGKIVNSSESAITIGDLKSTIKKMKKKAKIKNMSLEDYLVDLGLSTKATAEFLALDAVQTRGVNVIKKITRHQEGLFNDYESQGISIKRVMKDLGIEEPAKGKKLSYADAGKINAYIQNELGLKTGDMIEMETILQSIEDGSRYVDKRNEAVKSLHFVKDLLLSPKQVLGRTEAGMRLYRIFDRAQIFKEKDLEHIYGKTGFDIDKSLKLLKPDHPSNKRIAEALDGKRKINTLNAEEQTAVKRLRAAFDYMAERFVKLKVRDDAEERLVRQLAETVRVSKGEKIEGIKKKLTTYQKEFNISKGGMEALDMLRMKVDNYLPHLFDRGDLLKTAASRLQDIMAAEGSNSPQAKKLRDTISRLEGGEFIMHNEIPRELYFAHLEKRNNVEGYLYDAGLAFETYTKSWAKKVYVEPAVNAAKDLFINIPAEQKSYAKWFIMEQAGRNKRHPGSAIVSQAEWIRTLGLSLGSALGNATGIVNTITEAGTKPHAWEGFKRAATKEGLEEFYATGLARSIPQITAIDEVPHVLEKVRTVAGIFFNTVERGLRNHAYHTGKAQGEAMGLTGDDLVWHSIDFVNKTQHRYGVIGMARGMRGWGGVATQFSSYPIKQAELINSWLRNPETGQINGKGVQKVLAYMAMSAGINVTMRELLNTDVSNFLGIGISYGELMETAMAMSKGDWLEAEKHWDLARQGGHGILPSSIVPFGPFMGLLYEMQDMRSPQYLSRIGGELTPVMANKMIDFYYALRDGDPKRDRFPVYSYEAKDAMGKILDGPKDLKYTLGLKETILRAFGPRPAGETAKQAREFARFVTDKEIQKIVKQFDKALHKGDSKAIEKLFKLYPGIVFDRGTGGARRIEEKLTMTREERDARRLKQQKRRASLGFEL